jgi:hypothetical protein
MHEDVNVGFYVPLFYGLLFASLSVFAYAIVYLRQKRRDAAGSDP